MAIQTNLSKIKTQLPSNVTLVAVSKTKSVEDMMQAYLSGQRIFGENKIQEMTEKHQKMPKDIQWHMIGNIQRNKVKYMASYVDLVHGVDSFKLLNEINKQAEKNKRIIKCLIQIKIAQEDTKFGISYEEAKIMLRSEEVKKLNNIEIVGVMGMASYTQDKIQIKKEFKTLKINFDNLKKIAKNLMILSMGMSGDYKLAIENGSTMIRLGSSIFGTRNYTN
ncbi:YggS family pyridoxal phosphate-dependent enzyme [Flavobacteriaceae bacterium]|jgi:pyridoxal phosphate enzyme (YggS family)|nr:YggS family pyridoxal phosphate-dependent enzyme [Flavobacteriaceae bacterium]|tara:strand:+ start:1082 stop:1744 length:663 start_codon:yes stop_codon:yes gene_type:complete